MGISKAESALQKAYKAVQWLKARLDRKAFTVAAAFSAFGNAFGQQYRFTRVDRRNGWEWRYQPNGKQPIYLNDLSSPDNPSSRRYKGKLIKKLKAVTQIEAYGIYTAKAATQVFAVGYVINARCIADRSIDSGGMPPGGFANTVNSKPLITVQFERS